MQKRRAETGGGRAVIAFLIALVWIPAAVILGISQKYK
jgi:hypothetical protein